MTLRLYKSITKLFNYFLANLSSNRILITDKNLKYHQTVLNPLVNRLFNLNFNIYHDKNKVSYYSHVKSSIIFRYLIEMLRFSKGSVRLSLVNRLPFYLIELDSEYKAHDIAGLYDAEGHVKNRQIEINFSTSSRPMY